MLHDQIVRYYATADWLTSASALACLLLFTSASMWGQTLPGSIGGRVVTAEGNPLTSVRVTFFRQFDPALDAMPGIQPPKTGG